MGDANVNVNFNDAGVDGSITNIYGGTIIDPSEPPATMSVYSGNIALSNGSVQSGNAVSVDYAGVLNGNGDRLVLDGTMDGGFLGNPQIRGIELSGTGNASLNGAPTNSLVLVAAERN